MTASREGQTARSTAFNVARPQAALFPMIACPSRSCGVGPRHGGREFVAQRRAYTEVSKIMDCHTETLARETSLEPASYHLH